MDSLIERMDKLKNNYKYVFGNPTVDVSLLKSAVTNSKY
jgi:hypothetical protein